MTYCEDIYNIRKFLQYKGFLQINEKMIEMIEI